MNLWVNFKTSTSTILQLTLVFMLVGLLILFLVVMYVEPESIFHLLGLPKPKVSETVSEMSKYEVLKFIGISMGGVMIALQALIANKRANAMENAAKAQADAAKAQAEATEEQAKSNKNTEHGQRQGRLNNAVEHLGHTSESVRLGGAYELVRLAQDTEELRQALLDILCAHIRGTTGKSEYRTIHRWKPSEEIQSLLALLFVQQHEVFKDQRVELQGSWLNGADLYKANLQEANMEGAHLQRAILREADLRRAWLSNAHCQAADFFGAKLQMAVLAGTNLQNARLMHSRLQIARLDGAHLQGAELRMAGLQGAVLENADLQAAEFCWTHLQEASFHGALLQGITFRIEEKRPTWETWQFAEDVRQFIEQPSDMSGIIFSGDLLQGVQSTIKGLPEKEARQLQEKLEPHVGKPVSNELPADSGAITSAYTAEDAEKWIDEYRDAMSETG